MPPYPLAEQSFSNFTTKSHLSQKLHPLSGRYWHTPMPQLPKNNILTMPTEPEKKLPSKKMSVLLNTKELDLTQYTFRPNKALSARFIGLFQVMWVVNSTVLSFAFQATSNSTESSCNPPSRTVPVFTNFILKLITTPIQAITGQRTHIDTYQYRVLWKGHKDQHWVPGKHFEQAH
jgi:hypothetical protein